MLDVRFDDLQRLIRTIDRASPKAQRAMSRAIQDTKRRAKAITTRDIRREYTVKVAAVNKRVHILNRGADGFILRSDPDAIGLTSFSARETNTGVSYRIFKGGSPTLLRSAWKDSINSGGEQVWRRAYANGDSRPLVGRLPIWKMTGPAVSQMVEKPERLERLEEDIFAAFSKQLDARLDRLFSL